MKRIKNSFTPRQYMITQDFEFFHNKDYSFKGVDMHNHDFYEIFYLLSGDVTYMIEGKSYKVKEGDIIIINNKELHKTVINPETIYERLVIWINPDFLKRQSSENCDLSSFFDKLSRQGSNLLRPRPELLDNIKDAYIRLENVYGSDALGSDILKYIYMTELLVFLNRACNDSSDEKIDIEFNKKVINIINYINKNLDSDLTLETLSTKFYLSKYHLLREFKKHTGYSIHQYVLSKRLIIGRSLLREGMSVSDVSSKCGFGDYSNFIRSFRRSFGLSPKKYQKFVANPEIYKAEWENI
ncbi:MAG: AraC family transcriptional regulator [Bacillota bacterium]|nr:AraC family transcriptional regulator [Bacillota bacterium]